MKRHLIIFILSTLNIVLLGTLGLVALRQPASIPAPPQAFSSPLPSPTVSREARNQRAGTSIIAAKTFNWAELESSDFTKYIANLRAINCPEETIRDIVLADISKLYATKISSVAAKLRGQKFWESAARLRLATSLRSEVKALENERRLLVKELLGVDFDQELRRSGLAGDPIGEELSIGFLADEKRGAVQEILEKYRDREEELRRKGGRGPFQESEKELRQLRAERTAELAKVLSPQELEDYEVRNSSTADSLRNRMSSLALTEDEFRRLYQMQKNFEENNPMPTKPGFDLAEIQRREQARRELDQALSGVLGDDRYQQYQLSRDLAYRGLAEVAQQNNLPADSATRAYEIKQAVDRQIQQVMNDSSLNPSQRDAALQAMATETSQALTTLLGSKAYEDYKKNGGLWIDGINEGAITSMTSDGPGSSVSVRRTIGATGPSKGGPSSRGGAADYFVSPSR